VAVEVRNAGAMEADEVVQLYVVAESPAPGMPRRALKGFARITLRPGERRTVRFTLDGRAFSAIDADGERTVGPGRFTIAVGGGQPGFTTAVATAPLQLTGEVQRLAP
jgi:beta-glucosidase